MVVLFPRVRWVTSEWLEKEAGHMKKFKTSWVSGSYQHETYTINLCIRILDESVLFRIKTLLHELVHHIINLTIPEPLDWKFHKAFDWLHRTLEPLRMKLKW